MSFVTSVGVFAGSLFLLAGLSSCVAQQQFDDSQLAAKHYQDQTIANEKHVSELEDENRRLRAQLDASDKSLADAGFSKEAMDERLANLGKLLKDMGANPGDVSKFAVDGGYVYRVGDAVVFSFGSAELSEDGKKVLGQIAADISSKPYAKIYVRGHTDDTPIAKPETKAKFPNGNLQLSAERAVSVSAYLSTLEKIDTKRVVVMGFGSNEPVKANDSAENRKQNRRVDIFVTDADQAAPTDAK